MASLNIVAQTKMNKALMIDPYEDWLGCLHSFIWSSQEFA